MEWGISDMLANLEATIFIKKTVGELLFEGYQDDVMTIGADMNSDNYDDYSYRDTSYNYSDMDMDMNLDMEEDERGKREVVEDSSRKGDSMKMDKFGWFYDVRQFIAYYNFNTLKAFITLKV